MFLRNFDFKALLIVDNTPDHPTTELMRAHENIKMIFLQPNTTSLIEPFDQGVMKTFKMHYIRRTLDHIVHTIDNKSDISAKNAWKIISIADALTFIKASLKDMNQSTLINF